MKLGWLPPGSSGADPSAAPDKNWRGFCHPIARNRRALPSQIAQKRRNPGALALGTPGLGRGYGVRKRSFLFLVSFFH